MSYTISDLKNDLTSKLHGTSLNKLQGVDNLINESARQVLMDIDPAETRRISQLTNAIYSRVYDYQLPADVKGNKIIDIRPQTNREAEDRFFQNYSEQFDLRKTDGTFQVEYDSGLKYLKISKNVNNDPTLHAMNGITDNGTWAVGNDATNLTVDNLVYVSGSASLSFDLDGSTTDGYIENSTMGAVDLTNYEDKSLIFLYAYFPDASIITSVDLRWGNDSSNYWNRTSTTTNVGTSFQNGWNLISFDWNGATETGTGDSSDVDYLRVTVNYDGTADTDIRIDSIVCRRGQIHDIVYYSKYLFRDTSGTFLEEVSDDTDLINLDTDSYSVLLSKLAELAARNQQGEDSVFDYQSYREDYLQQTMKYKMMYPSEVKKPQIYYYRMNNNRRTDDIKT